MASIITSEGLNWILNKTFGSTSEPVPNKWEIGVDNTPPSESDTSCLGRVPHTYTIFEGCEATTGWAAYSGDALAPVLNTTDQLLGNGCIDLRVSYSAGHAAWSKTITSINLSANNRSLYLFFFINDLGKLNGPVRIYLGTDGWTNYNYYDFPKSGLVANEWQVLRIPYGMTPSGIGGTGANMSNINRIMIQLSGITSSWSGNECRMDTWHYANESDHLKDCEPGYPSINTTLHQVVWKVKYDTNMANGYKLQRLFFKNTTPMGFNSANYLFINKDSSKELTITTILRLRNP